MVLCSSLFHSAPGVWGVAGDIVPAPTFLPNLIPLFHFDRHSLCLLFFYMTNVPMSLGILHSMSDSNSSQIFLCASCLPVFAHIVAIYHGVLSTPDNLLIHSYMFCLFCASRGARWLHGSAAHSSPAIQSLFLLQTNLPAQGQAGHFIR